MTQPDAIERFTALYEETRPQIYAYAVSRAGRRLADEIVSEVFLVAWRRLADLPSPELPWLLAVARNVAASQFRTAVRQESIAAELRAWISEAELSSGDIAEQIAERLAVLTALAALPEPDRELLTLVAWHGLAPNAAAQVVGCSTATYFVRLHRARRRLDRALESAAEPPDTGRAGRNRGAPDRGSSHNGVRDPRGPHRPDSAAVARGVALARGEEWAR